MSSELQGLSRRGFVKKSLLAGGTLAAGVMAAEPQAVAAAAPAKAQRWDKSTDVVVVGYGGAGAVSAITAAENGASVIVLEKAPEAGGSTRCASGNVRTSSDGAKFEQFILATGQGDIKPEMAKAWSGAFLEIEAWMRSHGANITVTKGYAKFKGAFPNAETTDTIITITRDDKKIGTGKDLFLFLAGIVAKQKNIEVMLETPAYRLVQDPATKRIVGVIAKQGAKEIRIEARKGVVMSLGGFEGNREMLADYIQQSPHPIYPAGTPYNTGDGIRMAIDVGADLWHMNDVEWGLFGFKPKEMPAAFWVQPRGRSHIIVNKEGNRFLDESTGYSHVKKPLEVFRFDERRNFWPNHPWFLVFDEKARKDGPVIMVNRQEASAPFSTYNLSHGLHEWSADNSGEIERGWIKKGETIEELASNAGLDPVGLRKQIESYNESCKKGKDEAFGRKGSLAALEQGPFYCMELVVSTINTQGGPRRNAKCQVLTPFGEVLAGLYGAGEFGSMWSYLYPGGTNLGECIASGLIVGRAITGKI